MIPTTPTVPLMFLFCTKGEPSSQWQGLPVSTATPPAQIMKPSKTDPRRNLCTLQSVPNET
ncbi:hypothetical protein DAPPUDRAFT_331827 [Daphnia pulex]|uniref:Uncharacterized protein n=1 Tax=Daphnia pulex TaxID=6669 RepID=E9HNJ6_DAPPU|nr:hypothetical protein DAPPUDRAFT_331827 [Daphnia pulex]|eukprot:EFX66700.1 hypothetical protein DAPPUDRAFT_331827 [Daphnia pulex]